MTGKIRKEINSAIDKRVRSNVKAWLCVWVGGWTTGVPWITKKKRRKKGRMERETAIDVSFWGKRGVVGERDYGEVFSCAHKWSFFGILIAVRRRWMRATIRGEPSSKGMLIVSS